MNVLFSQIQKLADIADKYKAEFIQEYSSRITGEIRGLMEAITRCRTGKLGHSLWYCLKCLLTMKMPLSCGHRSCPQCQHQSTCNWLEKQQAKLLPVEYFMVTFTLPCELRSLIWHNQKAAYNAMFQAAASIIKDFAKNDKRMGDDIGFTIVLHTHSRKLDYHPHLHVVVTGGGYDRVKNEGVNKKGKGLPAMKYLSRYLYRGVISQNNILSEMDGQVTYQYRDNKGVVHKKKREATEFLWLVLQHVLPTGFRRTRDYGFASSGSRHLLAKIRCLLKVIQHVVTKIKELVKITCSCCRIPMEFFDIQRRQDGT
jgi:hypothetical protein